MSCTIAQCSRHGHNILEYLKRIYKLPLHGDMDDYDNSHWQGDVDIDRHFHSNQDQLSRYGDESHSCFIG